MFWPSPESITLIGAIIAVAGTLMAAIGVWRGSQEQARLSQRLLNQSEEIGARSERLVEKTEEIATLSQRTIGAVTGGESFVYLEPLRNAGRVRYFIRHTGDHPTYDVVVRVQEVLGPTGKRKRELRYGPADVGRMLLRGSGIDWTYPGPNPTDGSPWPLVFREPPPPGAPSQEFRIELAARNGIIVQRLRVSPVGDRWHTDSNWIKRPGAEALTLPADFKEAQVQSENRPEDYDDGK